jgi:hypothetical protein
MLLLGAAALLSCGGGRENDASQSRKALSASTPAPVLLERLDPSRPPPCPRPRVCVQPYLDFVQRARDYARPQEPQALLLRLAETSHGRMTMVPGPLPFDALRARVLDAAGIAFLTDGLDARPLSVTVRAESPLPGGGRQLDLVFDDPWVGSFAALLLLPPGGGPYPAVLMHPGHCETAEDQRDLRHGGEFPGRGYATLILEPRANWGDAWEDQATRALLGQGFTLIGLRVYEILLGFKYLRWRADIDPARIALLGHSGGAITGNLAVRVEPRFAAYVSDLTSTHFNVSKEGWLLDETSPELASLRDLVNEFSTSQVPVLSEEYEFPNGMDGVFRFLERKMNRSGGR